VTDQAGPRPNWFAQEKEWVLFSDESVPKGVHYSNFYGAVLVRASQIQRINERIQGLAAQAGLDSEVKWNKVTEMWVAGYETLVEAFFDEVFRGNLRVRIMFRQNSWVGPTLSEEQRKNSYFLLYYQFVKHAFGFGKLVNPVPVRLRLYFDQFPHQTAQAFRRYLFDMFQRVGRRSGLSVALEDITEVRSHDHILLQVLDILLGAMAFRLNDGQLNRNPGQRAIPKRTKARIRLYGFILKRIRGGLKPNFNIGVSTAPTDAYPEPWRLPYAHWAFVPTGATRQKGICKRAKKEPHSDLH